jgi:hypothetical protein
LTAFSTGLSAGIQQHAFLGEVARRMLRQLLAHLDVPGVRRRGEVRMRQLGDLALHRIDHFGRRIAHARHRDARRQIKEAVTIHIGDHRPRRAFGEYRHRRAHAGTDILLVLFHERTRARPGNLSHQLARDLGNILECRHAWSSKRCRILCHRYHSAFP